MRRLIDAIHILPERERRIVLLYYREEVTMSQIARSMGISESRVRQLHERALGRLRDRVAPERRPGDGGPAPEAARTKQAA
jgi:RNA polymerase sigma factor for flagellar operon FliA